MTQKIIDKKVWISSSSWLSGTRTTLANLSKWLEPLCFNSPCPIAYCHSNVLHSMYIHYNFGHGPCHLSSPPHALTLLKRSITIRLLNFSHKFYSQKSINHMCINYKYFIVVGLVCSYTASRYDESQIGNLVIRYLQKNCCKRVYLWQIFSFWK